jgi:timeless
MLEDYLKENSDLSVQKKTKARRKSSNKIATKATGGKKSTKNQKKSKESFETELRHEIDEKFDMFTAIEQDLLEQLSRNKDDLKSEVDDDDGDLFQLDFATSDTEIDTQKDKAIKQIQVYLKGKKLKKAAQLYREAKYLWPNEAELFGDEIMTSCEELDKIKNLFMKHYDDVQDEEDDDLVDNETAADLAINEYVDADDDGTADDEGYAFKEEHMDFVKFFARYTHSRIIKSYVYVLTDYSLNTDHQNNCCLKFFDRIVNQCDLPQYLYQLNLFNLIDKMHKDPLRKCLELNVTNVQSNETIFEFFRKLLARFFADLKTNPKLVLDLIFLKDKKLVYELNEGYGTATTKSTDKVKKATVWTDVDDAELKLLYAMHKDDSIDEADVAKQGDLVDRIMLNMAVCNRKRKEICLQLVRLGLVDSIDKLKETADVSLGRRRLWRTEDLDDLKSAFENTKTSQSGTNNKLDDIKDNLQIRRSKADIVAKLIELGLISDKREVTGTRKKAARGTKAKPDDFVDQAESSDGDKSSVRSDVDDDDDSSSDLELKLDQNDDDEDGAEDAVTNAFNKSKLNQVNTNESQIAKRIHGLDDDVDADVDADDDAMDNVNTDGHFVRTQRNGSDSSPEEISGDIGSRLKSQFKRRMYALDEDSNENSKSNTSVQETIIFDAEDKENINETASKDDGELVVASRSKRQRIIIDSDSD